ncbi:MAG: arsenate reductase (glutaredoxin) [Rhodobacteraceae bacterium]|nr:arsenate reductase (glutaredoxin) [Paracoccaceae bacterium]
MSNVKIWHNPKCSKSRATMALLLENGIEPEVMDYQKTPPSADELQQVITALDIRAIDLVRTNEAAFKQSNLSKNSSDATLIAAMVATPKLIERPVVLNGQKAAIGRPPESVLKIL